MTNRESLQNYLIDAIGSVVPRRGGAYVAGPLATGRQFYELVASGQDFAANNVREENEAKMKAFVSSLRSRLPYPVIDPSLIQIGGWTSVEIGNLYILIIDHFAKEIWFMDGWEYSRGATKEFQFAVTNNLRCLDARGIVISAEQGCEMISNVVIYLGKLGVDAGRFVDRIAAIQSIRT